MVFTRRITLAALLVSTFAAATSARAQALAERVPADALVYAGWAGADALGPAYDASRLKAFLDALNIPQFIQDRRQENLALPGGEQAAQNLKYLEAIAKAPTALYVGPFDFSVNPAKPVPRIALISKIGKDLAAEIAPKLNAVIQQNHQPDQPAAAATAAGEFLLVTIGDADLADRLTSNAPAVNLTKAPSFQKALAQLGPGAAQSAAVVYMDGQAVVQMLATAAQTNPNAQVREYAAPLIDGLGLNSLQQMAWAGNFDGGGWQSTAFVGMRDRRIGVLAFLDNPPLSADSLKLIPRSATSAGVFRFDGTRLLADITAAAAKVNDTAAKNVETVLTQAYVWTGIDLKRELFPAFGNEFVYYGSPDATGSAIRGFALVNRLRDAKKADSAMAAIENYANLMILQRDPNSKVQFQTRPLPAPWDRVTAHVLPMEAMTPCWAINNDIFFFSLSLPGLQGALDMADGKNPSILDNPQFVALRNKLAPAGTPQEAFSSFSFAQLARGFPETYNLLNRALTTALAQNPNSPPVYILPPLNRIMLTLGPTLKLYWSDAQGFHARESSPFPLAGLLTPTQYMPLIMVQQIRQRQRAAQTQAATNPGMP